MRDGGAALEEMIARIRSISGLAKRAAPDVAATVREGLVQQIKRGASWEGETWAPRKADGGAPLENAASALQVAPIGTRIFCRLRGPEARHDTGRARGGTIRKILPARGIPAPLAERIGTVLTRHFEQATKGKG